MAPVTTITIHIQTITQATIRTQTTILILTITHQTGLVHQAHQAGQVQIRPVHPILPAQIAAQAVAAIAGKLLPPIPLSLNRQHRIKQRLSEKATALYQVWKRPR